MSEKPISTEEAAKRIIRLLQRNGITDTDSQRIVLRRTMFEIKAKDIHKRHP